MDNRGFFKVLNKYYTGKPMQFVPAFFNNVSPPFPYATYQVRSSESDYIALDERETTPTKVIHKAVARTVEELVIKCYHKTDTLAYELSQEVMDLIEFKYRSEILKAGYGIIYIDRVNTTHEKTDNGYIYSYAITVTIDYNHEVTREYDKLKVVEIDIDNEKIVCGGK